MAVVGSAQRFNEEGDGGFAETPQLLLGLFAGGSAQTSNQQLNLFLGPLFVASFAQSRQFLMLRIRIRNNDLWGCGVFVGFVFIFIRRYRFVRRYLFIRQNGL